VDKRWIIDRNGKSFVTYPGLLDAAHTAGLTAIRTQLVQVPSPDNGQTAIVTAEVTTARGTFTGIGDASPENVARHILPHLIRMAETRAKARALRDAVNVGMAALEELGPDVDERPVTRVVTPPTPASRPAPVPMQHSRMLKVAGA
jgi:hypothetical protein